MITINNQKKIIFFLGIVFLLGTFYVNAKLHYSYDNPLPHKQSDEEEISGSDEEAEDDLQTIGEIFQEEDPVKSFLSEKIKSAIDLFFNRELHIVAIGDSLTQGVGDETENGGYVGILEERLNTPENPEIQLTNLGKRGNRTEQLLKRLDEEEDVQEAIASADIILVTIGANDLMQIFKQNFTTLTLEKFEDGQSIYYIQLKRIYEQLTTLNDQANIYFIGFYNPYYQYFPEISELNTIMENWNTEILQFTLTTDRASFIPVKDLFESADFHYLSEDNFHPNYRGYELFANRIIDYLMDKEGEIHEEREASD